MQAVVPSANNFLFFDVSVPLNFINFFYDTCQAQITGNQSTDVMKRNVKLACMNRDWDLQTNEIISTIDHLFEVTFDLRKQIAEELLKKNARFIPVADFETSYHMMTFQHRLPNLGHPFFNSAHFINRLYPNVVVGVKSISDEIDKWRESHPEIAQILPPTNSNNSTENFLEQLIHYFVMKEEGDPASGLKGFIDNDPLLKGLFGEVVDLSRRVESVQKGTKKRKESSPPAEEPKAKKQACAKEDPKPIDELEKWKQTHPAISQIQVVYSKPRETEIDHLLQQLIQFFLEGKDQKTPSDHFHTAIRLQNYIDKDPVLQCKLGSYDYEKLRARIKSTNEILWPTLWVVDQKPREEKRVTVQKPRVEKSVAAAAVEYMPPEQYGKTIEECIAEFLDKCYEERIQFEYKILLIRFRGCYNFSNVENRLGVAVSKKNQAIIENEINKHHPHLIGIEPAIKRKAHKELDSFVQKLIDWMIKATEDSYDTIANKILEIINNERLKPLYCDYNKKMIQTRIAETHKLLQ